MTPGTRARIVSETNGHRHVSSVVLAPHEIQRHLEVDADLHRAAGWSVDELRAGDGRILQVLAVSTRLGKKRKVWAQTFDPMSDA